jgi:hypothetical protein
MAGGMQPNVGLGAGVLPTDNMVGLSKQAVTTKTPQSFLVDSTPSTIDSGDIYTSREVEKLQEEYATQEKILAAQRQQFAELAAGTGTPQPRGAGSVNVGSRGQIQINPLNPVTQIKQPDILTGPFLGRWRR